MTSLAEALNIDPARQEEVKLIGEWIDDRTDKNSEFIDAVLNRDDMTQTEKGYLLWIRSASFTIQREEIPVEHVARTIIRQISRIDIKPENIIAVGYLIAHYGAMALTSPTDMNSEKTRVIEMGELDPEIDDKITELLEEQMKKKGEKHDRKRSNQN